MSLTKILVIYAGFIFVIFFCLSCDNSTEPESYYSKYYGNWEWVKSVGGIGGWIIYPEDETSVKISYDSSYRFRLYRNDTLKVFANYQITPDSVHGDKFEYSNIQTYGYPHFGELGFAQFSDGELRIWDGMIDGYFNYYKRN